jgi:hypothetical protein
LLKDAIDVGIVSDNHDEHPKKQESLRVVIDAGIVSDNDKEHP